MSARVSRRRSHVVSRGRPCCKEPTLRSHFVHPCPSRSPAESTRQAGGHWFEPSTAHSRSPANTKPCKRGAFVFSGGTGTRHVAYTWQTRTHLRESLLDCGLMAERGRGVRSWPFAGVMSRSEREIVVLRRAPMGRHLALANPKTCPNPPVPHWHALIRGRNGEAAPRRACVPHACTRPVALID